MAGLSYKKLYTKNVFNFILGTLHLLKIFEQTVVCNIAFEKLAPKIHIVHKVVAVFRYTLWMAYLVHTNNFRRNVKPKINIANEIDRITFI